MRRGLLRIFFSMGSGVSRCIKGLAAHGWTTVPLVLAGAMVLAWIGVALTGGRNWFAILLAVGISLSVVPVIRRERAEHRAGRTTTARAAPPRR